MIKLVRSNELGAIISKMLDITKEQGYCKSCFKRNEYISLLYALKNRKEIECNMVLKMNENIIVLEFYKGG